MFSESTSVVRDKSGHGHDGHIVDAQYGNDFPLNDDCVREATGQANPQGLETFSAATTSFRLLRVLPVLLAGVGVLAFAGWKFHGRKAIRPGEGLSASIYGDSGGGGLSGSAAPLPTSSTPVAPAVPTSGTIYD